MAKKKIKAKGAKARIEKVTKNGKDVTGRESKEHSVGEEVGYDSTPCNVGVSGGFTCNMGNFNSVKFQVSLNVPCEHEEINEAYEFAREWVDERVSIELAETEGD